MERAAFLERLRERLADPAAPAVAHPPGPAPAEVPPVRFVDDGRSREERFAAALARVQARLVAAEDLPAVLEELAVRTAVVTDERVPLPPDIERVEPERAAEADAGVTVAVAACAATGTVVAAASEAEPRAASVLCRVHVVGVPRDRLVDTPGDFLRGMDKLPSAFSMISGPARSADIEGNVVLGVHGPLAVVVVLLSMRLDGALAVVTGGAAGIGLATARALAQAGAQVVVADRERPPADVRCVETDVTDVGALERLFAEVGELAVLVNNAGGRDEPFFPDAPVERWSAVLDLNLRAPMLATQLAIAAMRRHGQGGAIVNVGSSAGVGYVPHVSPEYAAAKAGLMRLTGALAGLAGEGIRVSCVAPGLVDTPAARRSGAPIERARSAADIAGLIVALASDDTAGGRVVFWPEDGPARTL